MAPVPQQPRESAQRPSIPAVQACRISRWSGLARISLPDTATGSTAPLEPAAATAASSAGAWGSSASSAASICCMPLMSMSIVTSLTLLRSFIVLDQLVADGDDDAVLRLYQAFLHHRPAHGAAHRAHHAALALHHSHGPFRPRPGATARLSEHAVRANRRHQHQGNHEQAIASSWHLPFPRTMDVLSVDPDSVIHHRPGLFTAGFD